MTEKSGSSSAFQKFEDLARRLVAVPKTESAQKRAEKPKKKRQS